MFLLCITLCGCSGRNNPAASLNLTDKMHIDCYYRNHHLERVYYDSDKIDVILTYTHRLLTPIESNGYPRVLSGDSCKITVFMCDGTQRCYELQSKLYLRKNSEDWHTIDPHTANIVYHLINHIESDPVIA